MKIDERFEEGNLTIQLMMTEAINIVKGVEFIIDEWHLEKKSKRIFNDIKRDANHIVQLITSSTSNELAKAIKERIINNENKIAIKNIRYDMEYMNDKQLLELEEISNKIKNRENDKN